MKFGAAIPYRNFVMKNFIKTNNLKVNAAIPYRNFVIKARLKEGFTVDDWLQFLIGTL